MSLELQWFTHGQGTQSRKSGDNSLIFIDNPSTTLYKPDSTDIPTRRAYMNKSQLIDTLRKETVRGLCSIYVKDYKGYMGKNPKTGEPREVPAKKLPFFKCGKELKERVDYI